MADLLNVSQAAALLGISKSLIRRYCRQGRLGQKIGKSWIITSDELDQFHTQSRKAGYPKGKPRK